MGSSIFVAACRVFFSCSMWDLVPWPGIEPGPPALKAWNLSLWTTREVPNYSSSLRLRLKSRWAYIPNDKAKKCKSQNVNSEHFVCGILVLFIFVDPNFISTKSLHGCFNSLSPFQSRRFVYRFNIAGATLSICHWLFYFLFRPVEQCFPYCYIDFSFIL